MTTVCRLLAVVTLLTASIAIAQNPTTAPTDLSKAKPGDIVWLDSSVDLSKIPFLQIEQKPGGPQFLFSDKPEYFRSGNGIAMQEVVKPGVVRFYLYHVPTPDGKPHVISAVIENLGQQPMNFRFLKYAFQPPGGDYHKIGKGGLVDYFNSKPSAEVRTLEPGKQMLIDPKMEEKPLTKDILIHGLYEFEIDQPARVTTLQRDPGEDSTKAIDHLEKLPQILPGMHPSGAGRGLFLTSDYEVNAVPVLDTTIGLCQLVVADGKRDPWIVGTDSISGDTQQINKGNYGVMYKIRVKRKSSDGKGLAVVLTNGRADGKWCKFAAAGVWTQDGIHPGGAIPLPRDQVRFEGLPQAVVIQTFAPVPPGETQTIEFTYSPPGASCLPTPILFIPFKVEE
jgi:hypothetical protein